MPNYTTEQARQTRENLRNFQAANSPACLLADDLIAARARITELEGALKPFALTLGAESDARKAEYLNTDNISAFGYPPVQLGCLRHAAKVLKGNPK